MSSNNIVEIPKETLEWFKGDELRARVFYEKYALRDEEGKIIETVPEQMWHRIAREIASVEKTEELRKKWEEKFYWLLSDWRFIPGGRIMFGAGQSRKSTLLNCYVIPVKDDSIEAIFDWCKEAARTYSYGGGVGTDISILRPKGSKVNNSAVISTGAVSFMEVMSTTTGTIGQAGRRGALMISIGIEHPDIEDFIDVKKNLKKVNYANVSVRITDEFMKAVEKDETFVLHFKNDKVEVNRTVKAKDIWNKLVQAARDTAEPGLLFWDNVKKGSTTEYNDMEVIAVNPCAEISLDPYGCCCLGSINLSAFVGLPFAPNVYLARDMLLNAVDYATRFLDNVLDYNEKKHPLKTQSAASMKSRRIGVGFTGLGDMLIKLGIKYDSDESIQFVDKLFEDIRDSTYETSIDLALEKGVFPAFDAEKHLKQDFIRRLPENIKIGIKTTGLRNASILTVPPVGSGSVLIGSSSGVEPVFAFSYKRRSKSLSQGEFEVKHPLVEQFAEYAGQGFSAKGYVLPDYFVAAHQIDPMFRVRMQSTIQKYIDHAISSTVNLSTDTTTETVSQIYFQAWKMGCKGITVFREGSREGILETKKPKEVSPIMDDDLKRMARKVAYTPDKDIETVDKSVNTPFVRSEVLEGKTIKLPAPEGNVYVTANRDTTGKIVEVFVELGKRGSEDKAAGEAIGRLISMHLQKGGNIDDVIYSLRGIRGRGVAWSQGRQVLSLADGVAKALEILVNGTQVKSIPLVFSRPITPHVPATVVPKGETCPECQNSTFYNENGCFKCYSCGHSRC